MERFRTWLSIAPVVFLLGCGPPLFVSRAEVEITGEFRADGSCSVAVNNSPVFSANDSTRTEYLFHDMGGAPLGYMQNFLSCLPLSQLKDPTLGDPRELFMMFNVVHGKPIPTGNYRVRRVPDTDHPAADLGLIGGLLYDPRYDTWKNGGGIGGIGGQINLTPVSGTVAFVRIDTTHPVIGSFRMRARREWSM